MKKNISLSLLLLLFVAALVSATSIDQPNMESARANLQKAKGELQAARQNKGGHRAKALSLVNNAIAEVNKGIHFDRRHNHANVFSPDQPRMEAALNFLKAAKEDLLRATADKGGHRANAIKLVDAAMAEVNLGIAVAGN